MLEKYNEFNVTYVRGYVVGTIGVVLPMILMVVMAYIG